MTERFVLRDAIHALRATSGESHDADATRRRIVGTVVQRKRQRRTVIAVILFTFIGLPLGTTAYAAFFGTPAFVQRMIDRIAAPIASAPAQPARRHALRGGPGVAPPLQRETTPAPLPATPPAPPASTSATPSTSSIDPVTTIATSAATSSRATSHREPAATLGNARARRDAALAAADPAKPAPTVDPSDALYARAHELHFVTRDPAAALAAWDAYLARAPSATLLPEASYNRALCLVRLHRNSDAIAALTPFANGSFGSYRKREAVALLQALTRER